MADRIRFHPWIARFYDYINLYFEHRQAPPHRASLARDLSGTVLEIGSGTGTMIPYLDAAENDLEAYYGVEPDPGMRRQSLGKLAAATFDGGIVAARAERLPFPDDSIDAIVASCVFCSIPDVPASLSEITRVLNVDGTFYFFEHVRSPGVVGRSQDLITPVWRRVGGNCHLDREFVAHVETHVGLEVTAANYYTSGHYPIREFVRGRAHLRDDSRQ